MRGLKVATCSEESLIILATVSPDNSSAAQDCRSAALVKPGMARVGQYKQIGQFLQRSALISLTTSRGGSVLVTLKPKQMIQI